MPIDTSKFSMQKPFDILVFDLVDGACLAVLDETKKTTWENNGEVVYTTGAGGVKLVGFGHSKSSKLTVENGLITDGLLAVQSGSDVETVTTTTSVLYTDILEVATADELVTKFKGTGTTGKELQGLYELNSDGSLGKRLSQGATVAANTVTYTPATKKIAFNTGEATVGKKYIAFYYPTVSTAKKITNKTDVFAKEVKLICNGIFKNACDGKDYFGQLIYEKAKTSDGYSFDLTATGEPVVQSATFEALKPCGSKELFNLYIFDEADMT